MISNYDIQLIYIDLFCGAGGTTTGVEHAMLNGKKCARVIACVNHDALAIDSHASNHPDTLHFTEDIRTLDVALLRAHLDKMRIIYPNALVVLWASLECTNFSKAKGGKPRDGDSRTLADHLDRYVIGLDPDFVQIENVEEFMAWGEINDNGKPVHMKRGVDYIRWKERICSYGYAYDFRMINAADHGAYTSRRRYFGQFAKHGLPLTWPEATHSKTGVDESSIVDDQISMFKVQLKKWKPVKDVLDLDDEGVSIFQRETPLCEKTLERIYHGLIKYVAGGKEHFISKYYSGKPQSKNIPITGPAATVTTVDGQALVKACFMTKYNSNTPKKASNPVDINQPSPVISTQGRLAIVQAQFMQSYYGNGGTHSIEEPAPTVRTKDTLAVISTEHWIDRQFTSGMAQSIDEPAGAITTVPKSNLVKVEKWIMDTSFNNVGNSIDDPAPVILANRKQHYLMNPQFNSTGGCIEKPCFTLIAKMDKRPPYLVTTTKCEMAIQIYPTDTPFMVRIKEFMAAYGIIDIKMRMLRILELKLITGFPREYVLKGSQADQKKFIGNAVVTVVAQKITEALAERLTECLVERRCDTLN